jgi:nucleoside-diphosphate-sugar epimerase
MEDKIVTSVLVAEGTGVLGREVVPRLLEQGYTVRVMSCSS